MKLCKGLLPAFMLLALLATAMPAGAATTTTISDQASCEAIGGRWLGQVNSCELDRDYTVAAGDILVIAGNAGNIISVFADGNFTVASGGTVNIGGGSWLAFFGPSGSNAGTININSGNFEVARPLTNTGTIAVGSFPSSLDLRGALTNNGTITIACGGRVLFNNGSIVGTPPQYADCTAPTTTASYSGTPGTNGWYTTAGTVTLTPTDNQGGSGIAATTYTLDGGPQTPYTVPFAVTGDGTHTVAYSSTDNASNTETAHTLTLKIDTTAPTNIVGTPDRPADSNGWYTHAVTVDFTGTDALSGLPATGACTTGASYSSPDSATASVPGSCTDNAGNVGQGSFGLKYDATKPTVSYSAHPASYTADQTVSITCTAADATSGIATKTCDGISGPAYSFTLGTNTYHATATDNAGNTGTGSTSFTVTVNATALDAVIAKLVTDPKVAATLQQQADAIATAPNAGAKANKLSAFISAVNAQTGKSITAANATILINLAKAL